MAHYPPQGRPLNGCKKNTLENKSEIFCENNGGISACDANFGSAVQYKEIFESLQVNVLTPKVNNSAGTRTIHRRVNRSKI